MVIICLEDCDAAQLSKLWKEESLKRSNNRSTIELIVGVERWRARSPRYLEIFEVDHVLVLETQGWGCTLRLSHGKWHTRLLELIISLRQTFDISLSVYARQITESTDSTAIQLVPLTIHHQRIVVGQAFYVCCVKSSMDNSLFITFQWFLVTCSRIFEFPLNDEATCKRKSLKNWNRRSRVCHVVGRKKQKYLTIVNALIRI